MGTNKTIPVAAINNLVNYLYYDEEKHFKEYGDDRPPRDHIFRSVKKVADWLDQIDT